MNSLALIPPIQVIVDALEPVLVFFHNEVGVGWGMSIVLLTVCIRAALSPLMVKQFKSMKAMAQHMPKVKEVQEKYKGDKERQQQEVMKVYRENKINPAASCLPLLAQLPFFIGLFYLLQGKLRDRMCNTPDTPCGQSPTATGAEEFLFIPDLTDNASGGVLIVLIVLYISSQLLSGLLTPTTGDRNQKLLMYGLPFIFTPFIISFPSGLMVYWITTNLWTVGQGWVLRRRLGPMIAPEVADDGKKKKPPPPESDADPPDGKRKGLMARVMDAAEQQRVAKQPATANAESSSTGGSSRKSSPAASKPAVSAPKPARSAPPPRPPRKKKKRSGRRR